MMYHRSRIKEIMRDVIIENEKIIEVKSFRFLGIIIENKKIIEVKSFRFLGIIRE